jgi:transposase
MAKLKSGRQRIRLPVYEDPEHMRKMWAGNRKARAEAPRKANGRIMINHRYRRLLDSEHILGPVSKTYGGQTELNRAPVFVRDPVMRKRVVKFISMGYPYTTVCNFVGIKHSQFLAWLEKGKNGHNEDYIRFYRAVCRAEARGEMAILQKLRQHASADWRVSAWQLERIWPEKYGRVDRIRAETRSTISVTTDSKKDLGTKVIQDDVARELARRMIDGDAQLHFNALTVPESADA